MSTLTSIRPPSNEAALTTADATPPTVRSAFAGVMRGEWVKLLSLRSTWWTLGATVVLMTLVSFAAAMSLDAMAEDPVMGAAVTEMHGAEVISGGFQIGMLTIAVLGALFITGEYSTGMIRSTFAAVPTRLPVLGAKAIALVVLTVVVTVAGVAASYLVTMPRCRSTGSCLRSTTRGPGGSWAGPATSSSPRRSSRSASGRC